MAIFMNEADVLFEWLEHYITQGAAVFLLTDNGSTDDAERVLAPFARRPDVRVSVRRNATRHRQEFHYAAFADAARTACGWALVVDLDEFVYARGPFASIAAFLEGTDVGISQVLAPWKLFGSSHHLKQPPEGAIRGFVRRTDYARADGKFNGVIFEGADKYSLAKAAVRTDRVARYGIHSHAINGGRTECVGGAGARLHENNCFCKITEALLNASALHLNHYAIMSYERFMRVKATRGDVHSADREGARDEAYFRSFDVSSSDIEDGELAEIARQRTEL
jgi:hypothetical protein